MATLGSEIRQMRKARGLSLRQLATGAALDYSYLSKLENGRLGHPPSAAALERLAEALGADTLSLLALGNRLPGPLAAIAREPAALEFYREATERELSPEDWERLRAALRGGRDVASAEVASEIRSAR